MTTTDKAPKGRITNRTMRAEAPAPRRPGGRPSRPGAMATIRERLAAIPARFGKNVWVMVAEFDRPQYGWAYACQIRDKYPNFEFAARSPTKTTSRLYARAR